MLCNLMCIICITCVFSVPWMNVKFVLIVIGNSLLYWNKDKFSVLFVCDFNVKKFIVSFYYITNTTDISVAYN